MYKYVLKRLGLAFVTVFIILSLTFILIKMLKEDGYVGQLPQRIAYYDQQVHLGYAYRVDYKPGQKDENPDVLLFYYTSSGGKETCYFKTPILKQYGSWLKNIITKFDWGVSRKVEPNVKASVIIKERLSYSIRINIFAVLFSVPTGILLGIWAALKKNTLTDHIISTLVMVFIAIPSFVLISFILRIFAYNLGWLPTGWPADTASTKTKILAYIIPVFCLSFGSICGYCRYVRAELCEVMESEYLLLARTKGLTRRQAIVRHALKNAMVPIFPSILAEFIGILGGSMILENLYNIPGIGRLFLDALNAKDYNLLFVDMALFTTISLVAAVFLDISYGIIDPRIRMGAKK